MGGVALHSARQRLDIDPICFRAPGLASILDESTTGIPSFRHKSWLTSKSIGLSIVVGVLSLVRPATAATPELRFEAQTVEFEAAAAEYRALWATDGPRIIRALETATGVVFTESQIRVVVFEGVSNSGAPGVAEEPMMMRASYAPEIKKGTLIHELGHRILEEHGITHRRVGSEELDAHRLLFLFLYDIWADEFGTRFADANVAVERGRKGIYDYDAAWTWALAQPRQERARRFSVARSSEDLESGRQRMYTIVLTLHAWVRWLVLGLGVGATFLAIRSKAAASSSNADRWGLFLMMALDVQMLLGLLLYFALSDFGAMARRNFSEAMRDPTVRFWTVDHAATMFLAVLLVHVGRVLARKAATMKSRRWRLASTIGFATFLMVIGTPWPGFPFGRPLFRFR